jgi:hypothetical protein
MLMRQSASGPTLEYVFPAIVISYIARITQEQELDVAQQAAEIVLASPFTSPLFKLWVSTGLGLSAVIRKDVRDAAEQYDALAPSRGTMSLRLISGDRLLGLLAVTMEKFDIAADHFEEAIAFCHKARY